MGQTLLVEKSESGFMLLTLNRPEKRNAISYQLMDELADALHKASLDDGVKAVVITGAEDRAFCSGGDLEEFHSLHTEEEAYGMLSKMGDILYNLATFPKPTIALINGSAIGGGCEIATACDFRLAKRNVKLGFVQASLGIITGWGGATLLMEKLPYQSAMQLLLNGTIYTVEEAKEFGFIDYLLDDVSDFEGFIATMLTRELGVLVTYKELLVSKWNHAGIKERMQAENRKCAILWETDAHHEAVQRFLQK